jgi:hypothetical protein
MALDQFVMPGFAVYHIGMHTAKTSLMAKEGSAADQVDELDEPVDAGGRYDDE